MDAPRGEIEGDQESFDEDSIEDDLSSDSSSEHQVPDGDGDDFNNIFDADYHRKIFHGSTISFLHTILMISSLVTR